MKRALITGISGQDGSYLAELLLNENYQVHGIIRRSSSFNTGRIDHLYQDPHDPKRRLFLHYGDMLEPDGLHRLLDEIRPDEVYNLAAQSHVAVSFDMPSYTAEVTGLGALHLFEAVRRLRLDCKIYQASSSEMFGSSPPPQDENTLFHPRSPYAVAKLFAHHTAINYREAHGLWISCGILFNHESDRRGETFVSKKVTSAVARIKLGKQDHLYLGNLKAKRDWGWAPDYVLAMWMMLQATIPEDYVVGTGEMHSVQDFLEIAFEHVALDWRKYVKHDPRYERPLEVDALRADPIKITRKLGWKPSVSFEDMVKGMVDHDLASLR